MSSYYASIENPSIHTLGTLRQFPQLSLAWVETTVWVSGLDTALISDVSIKTIPGIQCFLQNAGMLYPLRSRLPWGAVPAVAWQPVATALPLVQPTYNHHFFEIAEKIPIALTTSEKENEATAMMVSCHLLEAYVRTAPEIRLRGLSWALMGAGEAIVIGSPLLPVTGAAYWRRGHILLPLGYDWEFPNLAMPIEDVINPGTGAWLVMQPNGCAKAVPFNTLVPLSRASVRNTLTTNHLPAS